LFLIFLIWGCEWPQRQYLDEARESLEERPGLREPKKEQPKEEVPSSEEPKKKNTPPYFVPPKDLYQVGYDTLVTLEVKDFKDPDQDPLSFRWKQLSGPQVSSSMKGVNTWRMSFRTHKLEELFTPRGPFGSLAIPWSGIGRYKFRVIVSDGVFNVAAEVEVRAASVQGGWPRAALNIDHYLFCGGGNGPWQWKFESYPLNFKGKLEDPKSCIPHFRPTIKGEYVIKEEVSQRELVIRAGQWFPITSPNSPCGRPDCHPREVAAWSNTPQSTVFKRGITGILSLDYNIQCIECHVLGYDKAGMNKGFDDIALEKLWKFPSELKQENWDLIPSEVKELANVQCGNCHGPAWYDTNFGAGVCGQCHSKSPDYARFHDWSLAKMSSFGKDDIPSKAELSQECSICHTAQAFINWEKNGFLEFPQPPKKDEAVPITCPACHNPMEQRFPSQLRVYNHVETLAGYQVAFGGKGAVCFSCHNSHRRPQDPKLEEARISPCCGNQGDILYGTGGFEILVSDYPAFPSPESGGHYQTTDDLCVSCHMVKDSKGVVLGGHTFSMSAEKDGDRKENIKACQRCHPGLQTFNFVPPDIFPNFDYDGDGQNEGIQDEVKGLLAFLRQVIEEAIQEKGYIGCGELALRGDSFAGVKGKIAIINKQKGPLKGCDGNELFLIPDKAIYRAAYNYIFVKKDRSYGIHNPIYIIRLLQRSIRSLILYEPNWVRR
jgi:hypothetical protein